MCSRSSEEEGALAYMEGKTQSTWTDSCQKCSSGDPVIQILQIKHAYCRGCFLTHVNHKFRSTLGKSKMMRPSDVVMAGFSGSLKSHVLLHLLHAGLSENSHKRFLFKSQVLYIDEGAILGLSEQERTSHLQSVAELVERYGYCAHYTSLAFVFERETSRCFPLHKDSTLHINEHMEDDIKQLFDNTKSLSAKEDLLKQLRRQLLKLCAKELGCGKIFLADSSTDLAIQILTDVSLGRGSQMHHDVTLCDDRDKNQKIMRPMLELSSKEIAFYSVYHELNYVFIPSLCTKAPADGSIHNLARQFVMDLMGNFPSTVSTVFRTGEKLGSNSSSLQDEDDNLCLLCQGRLDQTSAVCTSVQATEFSRLISSLGPCGFDSHSLTSLPLAAGPNLCKQEGDNSALPCLETGNGPQDCNCKSKLRPLTLPEIEEFCCYGCRLILHDMALPIVLPEQIREIARGRRDLKLMRTSIEEFLL